jgi:hypothetical protein
MFVLFSFTCYGLFSLGAHFKTCEPFISSIFKFFSGRSKSRVLNQWIWGHACIMIIKIKEREMDGAHIVRKRDSTACKLMDGTPAAHIA